MLSRLQINNYALIDSVDISFRPGFNVITGETGAGKSIMLGALSLILGGRADSRSVRSSQRKSVIEATFSLDDNSHALKAFCEENDIDWDPATVILRREITPAGRSRTFINDTPVTLTQLRSVAMHLVDIHSQHQNLLLASPEFQLEVIDRLAGNDARLSAYAVKYRQLRDALRHLRHTREELRKAREDEEFMRYQLEQLDALGLSAPDEQTELEQRRDILENLSDVKDRVEGALDALDGDAAGAATRLTDAFNYLESLAASIPGGAELMERLESAAIEVKDIADTLSTFNDSLEADPAELENIEDRLGSIYALQSRHHVDSLEQLIAIRDGLRTRLDSLEDGRDTLADLEKAARRAMALVKEAAAELSTHRREAAANLAGMLCQTAAPLGMANLRVEIDVSPADISATGADKVEFRFAFNKNQPLMPVANTASGGEISRLMLSLKAIISGHVNLPSIIFDEIDTGVSGDVATRMGRMMQQIGSRIQVIAITHLPQVASRGTSHFKVYKQDDEDATHTRITPLTPEERVDELSVMLSGSKDDPAARAAARALLSRQE